MEKEELILICAVRYALGRMSYVVSDVCNFVTSNREKLSDNCIKILIRDITEEIEMYHRLDKTCGMECDERNWMELLEVLRKEEEKHG